MQYDIIAQRYKNIYMHEPRSVVHMQIIVIMYHDYHKYFHPKIMIENTNKTHFRFQSITFLILYYMYYMFSEM